MPPDITALLSLQERDLRLQELRKELKRIPMEQEMAGKRLAVFEKPSPCRHRFIRSALSS